MFGPAEKLETPMPSIFHYTNSAGLLGILQTKCLFATDYRYLNDLSEGSMIRDLILPIFERENEEIIKVLVENELLRGFNEFYGSRGTRLQAEGHYKSLVNSLNESTPPFVLSFCRHTKQKTSEHGLLSQWRAYAGSVGFAIEFDESELLELLKEEHARFVYPVMKSDYVRYTDYNELFEPKAYDGVAKELIRRTFERTGKDISALTGQMDLDPVMHKFAQTAPFLKHDAFEEEQEYRIVGGCVRKDKIKEGATACEKEIKFRAKGEVIVPYIELLKTLGVHYRSHPSLLVHIHFRRSRQTQS
jgi:hypothetical protein